ncbi:B-cell receptor CD22-like [Menidia menidia]
MSSRRDRKFWRAADRPAASLEADRRIIPAGGSVTLTCSVEDGSDGWSFDWFKNGVSVYLEAQPKTDNKVLTVSDGGKYTCRGGRGGGGGEAVFYTHHSRKVFIKETQLQIKPTLRADREILPAGGSVTLTCSVEGRSDLIYVLYRGSSRYQFIDYKESGVFSIKEGGEYSCRGSNSEIITSLSDPVIIQETVPPKPTVVLQPSWTLIYRGETVTATCQIKGGGGADQWKYEWRRNGLNIPETSREIRVSVGGGFSCRGRWDEFSITEWSDVITVTVSDRPWPVLSVFPSWLSPGASVTLSCQLQHQDAGWSFSWYKAVPDRSAESYRYKLLPVNTNGTKQGSYILHEQTHTAGYVCRAGRVDREYHSHYSQPQFVWSADLHPAASLTVSPNRVQHFRSDSVLLICGGNSTTWRVKRFTGTRLLLHCSDFYWGTMTGSRCEKQLASSGDGVFWCESESGEFSNAINISVQGLF